MAGYTTPWRTAPSSAETIATTMDSAVFLDRRYRTAGAARWKGTLPTIRVPNILVGPTRTRYRAAEVLLAVGILSPGSRRTDRVTKFFEYADAGIEHYWLIDLDKPTSLAAYHLIGRDYELVTEQSGTVTVNVAGTPVTIDLAALTSSRAP
ncbi:Uma2 family endonuclease [Nocardia sp. NPDC057455]|uniref:Uma2 family endonuclease n=1 Tax=Nocardia sp. NPDC057455 TaxID=3346138 RepID=UPI00366CAD7E